MLQCLIALCSSIERNRGLGPFELPGVVPLLLFGDGAPLRQESLCLWLAHAILRKNHRFAALFGSVHRLWWPALVKGLINVNFRFINPMLFRSPSPGIQFNINLETSSIKKPRRRAWLRGCRVLFKTKREADPLNRRFGCNQWTQGEEGFREVDFRGQVRVQCLDLTEHPLWRRRGL